MDENGADIKRHREKKFSDGKFSKFYPLITVVSLIYGALEYDDGMYGFYVVVSFALFFSTAIALVITGLLRKLMPTFFRFYRWVWIGSLFNVLGVMMCVEFHHYIRH